VGLITDVYYISRMADFSIVCPHCGMQLTYCIGNPHAEAENGELQGFVFTCPSCRTPASYQPKEAIAVKMDKQTFENFRRAVDRKVSEQDKARGVAFSKQGRVATLAPKHTDGNTLDGLLKDIQDCNNYDDFLKRLEK